MIKVSAPGKCIIIGEHSVVYGKPAILAAISKRCHVAAEKAGKITVSSVAGDLSLSVGDAKAFAAKADVLWKECFAKKDFSPMFAAIKERPGGALKAGIGKILSELSVSNGAKIRIESEMPIGAGLGSSASLAVALTRALSELNGVTISKERINEIAFQLERYSHGTPSGGDNSACCFGGMVWFQKEPLTIKPLALRVGGFALVNVKKREKSTGELVQMVRNLEDKYRNQRIDALGVATEQMLEALKKKDSKRITSLLNGAQKNLKELGVSCREMDALADAVMTVGGGAKLSGAGAGGVMLCYHECAQKLKDAIVAAGYESMEVEIGAEGVRTE